MNLEHLFFELAPAIVNLFQYESEANESFFMVFSEAHYESYYRQNPDSNKETLYVFLPLNQPTSNKETLICNEKEKNNMISATEYIEKICTTHNPNGEVLSSFDDKLRLAAKRLPPIFSEGTKYSHIPL